MTERTHDLAAFTGLTLVITTQTLPTMTVATAIVAFGAVFLGGLAPDLDEPSAALWQRLPAGSIIGRILSPLLGSHRFISHSLLGMGLLGFLVYKLLMLSSAIVLVDMHIVWWSFMIGFTSHIAADMLTREGVPLLFPFPWKFGFPPIKSLRIQTGGMMEKTIIFPGLLLINGYLYYTRYSHVFTFIKQFIQ